jgi:hypothetical protein
MGLFFLILLVFTISPIFGGFSSMFILYLFKNNYKQQLYSLFILSLLLGTINSLKVPESDLINYIEYFNTVPKLDFFRYITLLGKEFVFFIFNYLVYYATSGHVGAYMVIFTTISYFILFYSILRMHKALKFSNSTFVLSISVAVLFPNLFSLSAHLMRQFLASSLICLFLVEYFCYNKKRYLIILIAILVHTTSFFFLVIFLPFFRLKISFLKTVLLSILGLVMFTLLFRFADFLASIFDQVPVLSYLFKRVSRTDDAWQTDNLGIINFILLSFNVLVSYIVSSRRNFKSTVISLQLLFFINLILLLFVIINFNNTEIALRYSFYGYFLVPFTFYLLPYMFSEKLTNFIEKVMVLPIIVLFFLFFIYKLNYGTWSYSNLENIFFLWKIN